MMSKKPEEKESKSIIYETLKALYFSGKVKPSLNKIIIELEKDPTNIDLTILACQCLVRGKDYEKLAEFADTAIKIDDKNPEGYYYKGLALHHSKGKEQEALKNFGEALSIDPENVLYLQDEAATHLALFTDYHLPLKIAEKHRDKGEESLLKIVSLIEAKENPSYTEYLTVADVSITVQRKVDAKKYYLKAVNAFEATKDADKNMNTYKDIIKGQKACAKLMEKFTEF